MMDAIGEAFDSRDRELRAETARAKVTADDLLGIAIAKFEDVCVGLESRIGQAPDRHFRVVVGPDNDPKRRTMNRLQVVDTARELDYFANIRDYHAWARLTFDTESGRSEILLSFHTVGRDFRGVVGASMCFCRKQESEEENAPRQVVELQTVADDLFQVNYKEDFDVAERRFSPWLNKPSSWASTSGAAASRQRPATPAHRSCRCVLQPQRGNPHGCLPLALAA